MTRNLKEYIIAEGTKETLQHDLYYHLLLSYGKYEFKLYVSDNYNEDNHGKKAAKAIINIADDHWNNERWELSLVAIEEGFLSSTININWYNDAFDGVIKSSSELGDHAKWKFTYQYVEEAEPFVMPTQLVKGTGEIDKQHPYKATLETGQYTFFLKIWNNINEDKTSNLAWFYVADKHWDFWRWHVGGYNTSIFHGLGKSELTIKKPDSSKHRHPRTDPRFEGYVAPLRLAPGGKWEFSYVLTSDLPKDSLPSPPLPKNPAPKPGEKLIAEGNNNSLTYDIPYHFLFNYGKFRFKIEIWNNYDDVTLTKPAYAVFDIGDDHWENNKWEFDGRIAEGTLERVVDITWFNNAIDGIITNKTRIGLYVRWRFSYKHIDTIEPYLEPTELVRGIGDIGIRFPYKKFLKPGKYAFLLKVWSNINQDRTNNLAWFYINDNHWYLGRWHVGGYNTRIYHGIEKSVLDITEENAEFNGYVAPLRLAPFAKWEFAYLPLKEDGTPEDPPDGTPPPDRPPDDPDEPDLPPDEPDPVPPDEGTPEIPPIAVEPEPFPETISDEMNLKTVFGQNNTYKGIDIINAIRANLNYSRLQTLRRHGVLSLNDFNIEWTGTMQVAIDRGYCFFHYDQEGNTYAFANVGKYHEIKIENSDKEYSRYDLITLVAEGDYVYLKYYIGEINDDTGVTYTYPTAPREEIVVGYILIPPRVQNIKEEDIWLCTKQLDERSPFYHYGEREQYKRRLPTRVLGHGEVEKPKDPTPIPDEWPKLYQLKAEPTLWNDKFNGTPPYFKRALRWEEMDLAIEAHKFFVYNPIFQFVCYNPAEKNQEVETNMNLIVTDDTGNEINLFTNRDPRRHLLPSKKTDVFTHNLTGVNNKEINPTWKIKYIYLTLNVFPEWIHIRSGKEQNTTFVLEVARHDVD